MGCNTQINIIASINASVSLWLSSYGLSCSCTLLPTSFLYLFFLIYLPHSLFMISSYHLFFFLLFSGFPPFFVFNSMNSQIDRQSETSDGGEKMLGGKNEVLFVCMCVHCVLKWRKYGAGYKMFPI